MHDQCCQCQVMLFSSANRKRESFTHCWPSGYRFRETETESYSQNRRFNPSSELFIPLSAIFIWTYLFNLLYALLRSLRSLFYCFKVTCVSCLPEAVLGRPVGWDSNPRSLDHHSEASTPGYRATHYELYSGSFLLISYAATVQHSAATINKNGSCAFLMTATFCDRRQVCAIQ